MKFCQFIENTNGTNFLRNLATFGQFEVRLHIEMGHKQEEEEEEEETDKIS